MKDKLIFATGNEGKMREIRAILGDLDYEILSLKEAGVAIDIVEDGETFEENAVIKAKAVMEATGCLTLADDSGLEIDFLNKEPVDQDLVLDRPAPRGAGYPADSQVRLRCCRSLSGRPGGNGERDDRRPDRP